MTHIKFCGLTRAEDAAQASRLGAAFVGAIFAGGPRALAPDRAADVWAGASDSTERVGVFGADFREQIPAVLRAATFHVAQLHGDPTAEDVRAARDAFGGKVWAAVRVAGTDMPDRVQELFDVADAVLFDPKIDGKLGGTGVQLDWTALARGIERSRGSGGRVVLAGGLTHENVVTAIAAVRPWTVDVSSGVESAPGVKDHARMTAFAEAVRRSGR